MVWPNHIFGHGGACGRCLGEGQGLGVGWRGGTQSPGLEKRGGRPRARKWRRSAIGMVLMVWSGWWWARAEEDELTRGKPWRTQSSKDTDRTSHVLAAVPALDAGRGEKDGAGACCDSPSDISVERRGVLTTGPPVCRRES